MEPKAVKPLLAPRPGTHVAPGAPEAARWRNESTRPPAPRAWGLGRQFGVWVPWTYPRRASEQCTFAEASMGCDSRRQSRRNEIGEKFMQPLRCVHPLAGKQKKKKHRKKEKNKHIQCHVFLFFFFF